MAHLEKVRRQYRVVWRDGGRGSARHKTKLYDHKADAETARRAIEDHQAASRPSTPGLPMVWPELVTRYLNDRAGRTTEAHRVQVHRTLAALARDHGWLAPIEVTPTQASALRPYHARLVRALLTYAHDHHGQAISPQVIAACRTPAPRRKPSELLSNQQIAKIQAAADHWHPADGAMVHLVATYGHRLQSLLTLTAADLILSKQPTITLRVKSGDIHRHPLLPATVARLRPLAKANPTGPILVGHLERPWKDSRAAAAWIGHSLGIGVLDLRRAAITHLLDACGGDARTAASITGHRTPSLLLNTYARTSEQRQKAALAGLGDTTVTPRIR